VSGRWCASLDCSGSCSKAGGRPCRNSRSGSTRAGRTIYRDLLALQDAGYPIAGDEQGFMSRPCLAGNARQARPEIRLNEREVQALLWAASRESLPGQPFAAELASATVKLQAMLGARAGRAGEPIHDAISVLRRGQKDYSPHRETVLRLVESILRRWRVRICYASPARPEPHDFEFDPYRLLVAPDGLYCVGRTPEYGQVIMLAVDRIRAVSVLEARFEVDPSSDLEKLSRDAFGVVWEEPMTVVVRFSAEQAPYVKERVWHPSQAFRELAGGGVEMTFRAGGEFEIVRWILGWGDAAEVVEPAELRERVAEVLGSAFERYRHSV